ncbi:MAG: hypothetical protein QXH07_06800 [Thermoplasmata archaeon]
MSHSYIIYKCYDCNVKRVFGSDEGNLAAYIRFDKIHHDHSGYIMIEKISSTDKDEDVILKIANEWKEYADEIISKNGEDNGGSTEAKGSADNKGSEVLRESTNNPDNDADAG